MKNFLRTLADWSLSGRGGVTKRISAEFMGATSKAGIECVLDVTQCRHQLSEANASEGKAEELGMLM